jgi:hypothetical protein
LNYVGDQIAKMQDVGNYTGMTALVIRMVQIGIEDRKLEVTAGLMKALLPLDVNVTKKIDQPYRSVEELRADLLRRGLPEKFIFELEHHDPNEVAQMDEPSGQD